METVNKFAFSLVYPYLWLHRRYFRSTNQRKTRFPFDLCSLNRTFAQEIMKAHPRAISIFSLGYSK